MKRFYVIFCMALITMFAFAGGIKVSKGKASYMKTEGKIFVVFDWTNAKWDHGKSVKAQWGEEYDAYVEQGEAQFVEGYNKESKKVKIIKEETNTRFGPKLLSLTKRTVK